MSGVTLKLTPRQRIVLDALTDDYRSVAEIVADVGGTVNSGRSSLLSLSGKGLAKRELATGRWRRA